jgi:hypothetical protein
VQHEPFGHHLDDLASLRPRQGRLEHRLVHLGVKGVADGGGDGGHAMLGQYLGQLSQGQLQPFDQGGGLAAGLVGRDGQGARQVVVDREQVAGEAGAAVLFSLATVAVGTFAGVFGA